MKKRCFSVLMLLLLCLALVLPAAAADAHPPRVVDDGGWFTQTEFDDLTGSSTRSARSWISTLWS